MVRKEIRDYIEQHILPRYETFDAAHRTDHATTVIERSMKLARHYEVNEEMVYVVAAYHDIGLEFGREMHHRESARLVMEDKEEDFGTAFLPNNNGKTKPMHTAQKSRLLP